MSLKTVATFIFGISRLPRGLEIPSWTFLKSPFCADFKNIQFFLLFDEMYTEIFPKYCREGNEKVNIFWFIVETTT